MALMDEISGYGRYIRLPPKSVRKIVRQLAETVSLIHDAGVVHGGELLGV